MRILPTNDDGYDAMGLRAPGTDLGAAADDRITVTLLHPDLTHEPSLAALADRLEGA